MSHLLSKINELNSWGKRSKIRYHDMVQNLFPDNNLSNHNGIGL